MSEDEKKNLAQSLKEVEAELPPTGGVYPFLTGYLEEATGHFYDRVQVDEMSGVEEDLIAKKEIPLRERLDTMMSNVVKAFIPSAESKAAGAVPITSDREKAFALQNLPSGEAVTILIASRRLGHGDMYEFIEKCPNRNCQKKNKISFDLKNLPTRVPEDRKSRTHEVKIRDGSVFKFNVLLTSMDDMLEDLQKSTGDKYTSQLFVRLVNPEKKISFEDLKKVKSPDREIMRKAIRDHEPSIKTDTTVECDGCGTEWESDMEVFTKGFFFPTEM